MNRLWIESPLPDKSVVADLIGYLEHHELVIGDGAPASDSPGVFLFDPEQPGAEERLRALIAEVNCRVIAVATAIGALPADLVWRLLASGAADVMQWTAPDVLAAAIAARVRRWEQVDQLVKSPEVNQYVVGTSPCFLRTLRQVVEVAAFTNASALLLGESGTGKEQVARLIHSLDRRGEKRELVVLDCSTVMAELSGSEFFGHERGAFTGAIAQRNGAFAIAEHGTLFLDEVGELPLALQAQLLRVVQERVYKRVGGNQWYRADFRLVTATNRDLTLEVENRGFRADFYHRIAGWVFRLPPLRERRADIRPLAEHFARQCLGTETVPMDDRVQEFLLGRDYPGNVRELRQVVARLCALHVGTGPITVGDISPDDLPRTNDTVDRALDHAIEQAVGRGAGLREIVRAAREAAIRSALEINGRSVQQAAKLLKVTDRALQMELAKREG